MLNTGLFAPVYRWLSNMRAEPIVASLIALDGYEPFSDGGTLKLIKIDVEVMSPTSSEACASWSG